MFLLFSMLSGSTVTGQDAVTFHFTPHGTHALNGRHFESFRARVPADNH